MNRETWMTSKNGGALWEAFVVYIVSDSTRYSRGRRVAIDVSVRCGERAMRFLDGLSSLEELAQRAVDLGRQWLAEIPTEHTLTESSLWAGRHRAWTLQHELREVLILRDSIDPTYDALLIALRIIDPMRDTMPAHHRENQVLVPPNVPTATWDEDNAFLAEALREACAAVGFEPWQSEAPR